MNAELRLRILKIDEELPLTLSIEASAKASSVALTRGEMLVAQYFQNSGLTHSRTLLCMVEGILKNNELAVSNLGRIAVGRGPGSFTGIRIALAAARGIAFGAEIPLVGVSTLAAAVSVFEDENVILCPVMDARRNEVYNAMFERRGGEIVRLCEDRAIPTAELAEELRGSAKPVLLIGDGAELTARAFEERGVAFAMAPAMMRLQCAYGVALAAEADPLGDAEPNYLRISQAERERETRLAGE